MLQLRTSDTARPRSDLVDAAELGLTAESDANDESAPVPTSRLRGRSSRIAGPTSVADAGSSSSSARFGLLSPDTGGADAGGADTKTPAVDQQPSAARDRNDRPPPEPQSGADRETAIYGAGVPNFDEPIRSTSRKPALRTRDRARASGAYRGPYAGGTGRRSVVGMADPSEASRLESAGLTFALLSTAPYAASVAIVLVMLLASGDELAIVSSAMGLAMPGLPAFTLLALFAGGLLAAAGALRGMARGVTLTALGIAPMAFIVPAIVDADSLSLAIALMLPLFLAVSYGACATTSRFPDADLPRALAGTAGFVVAGVQLSLALSVGDQVAAMGPGGAEWRSWLFVVALAISQGPILAVVYAVSGDEKWSRNAVRAHWVGYLIIPAFLAWYVTGDLGTPLALVLTLLFIFGWAGAAGAGVRDLLTLREFKLRSGVFGAVATTKGGGREPSIRMAGAGASTPEDAWRQPGTAPSSLAAAGEDAGDDAQADAETTSDGIGHVPLPGAEQPDLFRASSDSGSREEEDDPWRWQR